MEINPITEVAIIGIITSLKSKNSSGYDEVSSKIIKLCGLQISRALYYVCNKYICVGIFNKAEKCCTLDACRVCAMCMCIYCIV
jgi:hypothetical protein